MVDRLFKIIDIDKHLAMDKRFIVEKIMTLIFSLIGWVNNGTSKISSIINGLNAYR